MTLRGGNMAQKVILGLSGGVDSSVAAIKLLQQGYDVEAMFMRNWDSATNNDILGNPDLLDDVCPQERDYNDALAVANKLGIKLHRIDFIAEYWDYVFTYFINEYEKGRTPNPDIMCNKYIKFNTFLKEAKRLGANYIAMGHYARVKHFADHSILLRGIDDNKDQTYFLCMISQEQLQNSLFPIGEMLKKEVRDVALEYDLATAKKKDSTGICFIGERNFKEFLKNYLPAKPGNMVTIDGKIVARHDGLMYYTIGQRKGLGIGGNHDFENSPWFVIGKDLAKNELIIGQGEDNKYLYSNHLFASSCNWIYNKPEENKPYTAKFRYRQKDIPVKIKYHGDNIEIIYDKLAKAVTPGQAAVIYDGEICLGGAIIDEVYMNEEKRRY